MNPIFVGNGITEDLLYELNVSYLYLIYKRKKIVLVSIITIIVVIIYG